MAIKDVVVAAEVPKGPDVVTRFKVTRVGDRHFVQIRDYVVSRKEEMRGVVFPVEQIDAVAAAVNELKRAVKEQGRKRK